MLKFFKRSAEEVVVSLNERASELIHNILPEIVSGRTDEEKNLILSGKKIEIDDSIREIIQECVDLIRDKGVDRGLKTYLSSNIREIGKNYVKDVNESKSDLEPEPEPELESETEPEQTNINNEEAEQSDPNERADELIRDILPGITLGRTDKEKETISSGVQIEADDEVRKIFKECVELLNVPGLDKTSQRYLLENVTEMRINYHEIEEIDLDERAHELILILQSEIYTDKERVRESNGEKIEVSDEFKSIYQEGVILLMSGKLNSEMQETLQQYIYQMGAIYSNLE